MASHASTVPDRTDAWYLAPTVGTVGAVLRTFLTHNPEDLEAYFGRSLPSLHTVTDVVVNPLDRDLTTAELIEHSVSTLLRQRIHGIALGYEDLNDHDQLRHDPVFAVLAGKLHSRSVARQSG